MTRADSPVRQLLRRYEIYRYQRFELAQGAENHVVGIHDGVMPYVLVCFRSRDLEGAQELARLHVALAAAGIDVPRVIPDVEGNLAVTANGACAMLLEFVRGDNVGSLKRRDLSRAGRTLGTVHLAPLAMSPTPTVRIRPAVTTVSATVMPDGARPTPDQSVVPTHSDLFRDNLIVKVDGSVVFIDWDDSCMDFDFIDIGTALLGLCSDAPDFAAAASTFLAGYTAARSLPKTEDLCTGYVHAYEYLRWYRSTHNAAPPRLGPRELEINVARLARL